ncbi:XRE family transcriptional regulator [Gordonia humi]|uniref:Transcriptional regulator with XRE-family HTH domain n=1 Tax=Gordonia humi TaxID=686429 RepID=A0A840EVL1_9ACTN|nr:XRE family transcriptional regulator [Gordonia humi]MBB4134374.1 transcriptional regulator with XRE-family HTH domain [Gordonia humi]
MSDGEAGDFALRLDELFRNLPGPDGRPYSAKTIAQRAADRGYRIGESYLSQLRSGKARSPSFRTVEGLAAAFDVDIRHFLTDEDSRRTRDEIEQFRAMADPEVHRVAKRLAGLPKETIAVVDELVDVLHRRRGPAAASDLHLVDDAV